MTTAMLTYTKGEYMLNTYFLPKCRIQFFGEQRSEIYTKWLINHPIIEYRNRKQEVKAQNAIIERKIEEHEKTRSIWDKLFGRNQHSLKYLEEPTYNGYDEKIAFEEFIKNEGFNMTDKSINNGGETIIFTKQ